MKPGEQSPHCCNSIPLALPSVNAPEKSGAPSLCHTQCCLVNQSFRHFCGKISLTISVSLSSILAHCYRGWIRKQSKLQKPHCSQNCSSSHTRGTVTKCSYLREKVGDSTNPLVPRTNRLEVVRTASPLDTSAS